MMLGGLALLLVACQPAEQPLPTLVAFPSETITPESSPTQTDTPVPPTDSATETATSSPTATVSHTPTETYTPSATPTASKTSDATWTPDAQESALGTATAQFIEAPRYATLTPLPPGIIAAVRPTSTGAPEMVADVVIYEYQFEEEIDRILAADSRISAVRVDFAADGLAIELTALSGSAFVTGDFTVNFTLSAGGFNNILLIGGLTRFTMRSGGEPSQDFVELAATVVVPAVQEAFDFILNQRLGEGRHNLESIVITDTQMGVTLLVPDNR
jgi:hypothetical protein